MTVLRGQRSRVLTAGGVDERTGGLLWNQIGRIPAADIIFVLFAITFFASRLVYYPRYLLWTVLYASLAPCFIVGALRLIH